MATTGRVPGTGAPGVYVLEAQTGSAPIAGVGTSTPAFIAFGAADLTVPKLDFVTNFSEFKRKTGPAEGASEDASWTLLAHAVYGFFQNGGTGAYVARGKTADATTLKSILDLLSAMDNVQLIVAPGITDADSIKAIIAHCTTMQDRFAILDTAANLDIGNVTGLDQLPYGISDYAALYYPWIQVPPITEGAATSAKANGNKYFVPPSGHIAGLYARVDGSRGVHKAPANEVLLGVTDVKDSIPTAVQDYVNPLGINCIRQMNGAIRVWGARTMGGDQNHSGAGDFKYVHVRRLFNFIRTSLDRGTQWVVFEPNSPNLWAKVTRNLSAFLRTVWEQGALFGNTPEQAFYVKCDEETNPPEQRGQGKLHAEIGVNIVPAAEFVIFHLGQWEPEKK
jgi:phage tail sheath protein FI